MTLFVLTLQLYSGRYEFGLCKPACVNSDQVHLRFPFRGNILWYQHAAHAQSETLGLLSAISENVHGWCTHDVSSVVDHMLI